MIGVRPVNVFVWTTRSLALDAPVTRESTPFHTVQTKNCGSGCREGSVLHNKRLYDWDDCQYEKNCGSGCRENYVLHNERPYDGEDCQCEEKECRGGRWGDSTTATITAAVWTHGTDVSSTKGWCRIRLNRLLLCATTKHKQKMQSTEIKS